MNVFIQPLFYFLVCLLSIVYIQSCIKKEPEDPLNQYREARVPEKFFPGEVSVDALQWNNALAESNRQIFYCQQLPTRGQLVTQTYSGKGFSAVEVIPFDTLYSYSDPWVSQKADHMIFMSNRPYKINKDSTTQGFQLWQSFKKQGIWKEPEIVFPTSRGVGFPSKTEDGTLFYSVQSEDGSRNSSIYYSDYNEGRYTEPIKLPKEINTDPAFEGDAFVMPDKSFLIFAGFDRPASLGFSDLYISFNQGNGQWTPAKSLGDEINSEGYDGSPYVTEDGKYLVFTSSRDSPGNNSFFNHYIVRFDVEEYR